LIDEAKLKNIVIGIALNLKLGEIEPEVK